MFFLYVYQRVCLQQLSVYQRVNPVPSKPGHHCEDQNPYHALNGSCHLIEIRAAENTTKTEEIGIWMDLAIQNDSLS